MGEVTRKFDGGAATQQHTQTIARAQVRRGKSGEIRFARCFVVGGGERGKEEGEREH